MSIEERIEYATNRRDEAIKNGTDYDVIFWNGYLDGIKAVRRDFENDTQK